MLQTLKRTYPMHACKVSFHRHHPHAWSERQYKHGVNPADRLRLQRLHTICSGLRTTKVAGVLHILLIDPEVMFQVLPPDLLGWLDSLHLQFNVYDQHPQFMFAQHMTYKSGHAHHAFRQSVGAFIIRLAATKICCNSEGHLHMLNWCSYQLSSSIDLRVPTCSLLKMAKFSSLMLSAARRLFTPADAACMQPLLSLVT